MLKVVPIVTAACKFQTTGQVVAFFVLSPIYYHTNHNTASFDTFSEETSNPISTKVLITGLGGKDHDKDETKLKTCPETLPEKSNEFQRQTRRARVRASVAHGTARAGTCNGTWLMDYTGASGVQRFERQR